MEKKTFDLSMEVLKRFERAGIFGKMHKKWQKTIIDNLRTMKEEAVIDVLEAK